MLDDKNYKIITDKVIEVGGEFLNDENERLLGFFVFSIRNREIAAKSEGGGNSWKLSLKQPNGLMRTVTILAGTDQLLLRIGHYAQVHN